MKPPDINDLDALAPALRAGDEQAWRTLVRELAQPLFHYAAAILARRADAAACAEDVVQQGFLKMYRSRKRLDPARGSVRGYCYRIVANLARNALRDGALRAARERAAALREDDMAGRHAGPEREVWAREAWSLAMALPDEQREVLLLRFGHGLSRVEIGHVLGLPESTVGSRQQAALAELRVRLGPRVAPALAAAGLDALGRELAAFPGFSSQAAAHAQLLANVETALMAGMTTKSAGTLTAALIAILLIGAGIGGWFWLGGGDSKDNGEALLSRDNHAALGAQTPDNGQPSHRTPESNDSSSPVAPGNGHTVAANNPAATTNSPAAPHSPPVSGEPEVPIVPAAAQPDGEMPQDDDPDANAPREPYAAWVEGIVVTSAGEPVPGAEIVAKAASLPIDRYSDGTLYRYLAKLGASPDGDGMMITQRRVYQDSVSGRATSTGDGSFTMELRGLDVGADREVLFALDARSLEGLTASAGPLSVKPGGRLAGVRLVAVRGARIFGRIVDWSDQKAGIARVEVRLHGRGLASGGSPGERMAIMTAADGSFEFAGLMPAQYGIGVRKDGYCVADRESSFVIIPLNEGQESGPLTLRMVRASSVRFRLKPVPDDEIVALIATGSMTTHGAVKRGTNGDYTIADLSVEMHTLVLCAAGFRPRTVDLVLVPGQELNLGELELARSPVLRGRVIDSVDKPVSGVTVTSRATAAMPGVMVYGVLDPPAPVMSDADGRFSIEGLSEGDTLVFTHPGFCRTEEQVWSKHFAVEGAAQFTLYAGGSVLCRVRETAGTEPVREAKLYVIKPGYWGADPASLAAKALNRGSSIESLEDQLGHAIAMSGELSGEGERLLGPLPPGAYIVFAVTEHRCGYVRVEVAEGTDQTAEIVLASGAAIAGSVRRGDGSQVASRPVLLVHESDALSGEELLRSVTDGGGRYAFDDVPPGRYLLLVEGEARRNDEPFMASRRVVIGPTGGALELNILLGGVDKTTLNLRVTLGGLAAFCVAVLTPADRSFQVIAPLGAGGAGTVDNLPPGPYDLYCRDGSPGWGITCFAWDKIDVRSAAQDYQRDFTPATLRGTASMGAADAALRAKTRLIYEPLDAAPGSGDWANERSAFGTLSIGPDGEFTSPPLAVGRYRLTLMAPNSPVLVHDMTLPLEAPLKLETPQKGASLLLRFTISIPGENPWMALRLTDAAGRRVYWSFEDGGIRSEKHAALKEGESMLIGGLAPGIYTAELTSALTEPLRLKVTLKAGEITEASVAPKRGASIVIRVTNSVLDDIALAAASVRLLDPSGKDLTRDAGGGVVNGATFTNGALKFNSLAAGTYSLSIEMPGYRPFGRMYTLESGQGAVDTVALERLE